MTMDPYGKDGKRRPATTISGVPNGKLHDRRRTALLTSSRTPDGTSIITNSADSQIRTFIVYVHLTFNVAQLTRLYCRPPDLLEEGHGPHELIAYSTLPAAESVNTVTAYPMFDLQNPSTTLLLSSQRDHPIRLNSALTPQLVASYPLVNPTTEAFISPHSLLFTADGQRFLAGSESLLSIFDLSRPGDGPVGSYRTGKSGGSSFADSGMSLRGILSALAIEEQSGILAAGTFSRNIGLYDSKGQGDCIGVFCVKGTEADLQIGGSGATQVIWSPCGRYLYIAERKSDGAMIYDIRVTGRLLGWLKERRAVTSQRLGVHVVSISGTADQEVWAGGTDGMIRAWRNPHMGEGAQSASFEWHGHNGT